jgi:hypothetical protein
MNPKCPICPLTEDACKGQNHRHFCDLVNPASAIYKPAFIPLLPVKSPSALAQLATAGTAIAQTTAALAHGESPFVQTAEQNAREAICRDCDRFEAQWNRCLECKCFLAIKTWLKAQSCPIGKW